MSWADTTGILAAEVDSPVRARVDGKVDPRCGSGKKLTADAAGNGPDDLLCRLQNEKPLCPVRLTVEMRCGVHTMPSFPSESAIPGEKEETVSRVWGSWTNTVMLTARHRLSFTIAARTRAGAGAGRARRRSDKVLHRPTGPCLTDHGIDGRARAEVNKKASWRFTARRYRRVSLADAGGISWRAYCRWVNSDSHSEP